MKEANATTTLTHVNQWQTSPSLGSLLRSIIFGMPDRYWYCVT